MPKQPVSDAGQDRGMTVPSTRQVERLFVFLALVLLASALAVAFLRGGFLGRTRPYSRSASVVKVPELTLRLVRIPRGDARVGGTWGCGDEGPVQSVHVDYDLWFAVCEVTLADYVGVVGNPPEGWRNYAEFYHERPPRKELPEPAECPAAGVAWSEAVRFAELLTQRERNAGRLPAELVFRLPTEREWEVAASAQSESHFFFGDAQGELWRFGNYADTDYEETHRSVLKYEGPSRSDGWGSAAPVRSFTPNSWGIYDVHGNVFEWCLDRCLPVHSEESRALAFVDAGFGRVAKGGCFGSRPFGCRVQARGYQESSFKGGTTGSQRRDMSFGEAYGVRVVLGPPAVSFIPEGRRPGPTRLPEGPSLRADTPPGWGMRVCSTVK